MKTRRQYDSEGVSPSVLTEILAKLLQTNADTVPSSGNKRLRFINFISTKIGSILIHKTVITKYKRAW